MAETEQIRSVRESIAETDVSIDLLYDDYDHTPANGTWNELCAIRMLLTNIRDILAVSLLPPEKP